MKLTYTLQELPEIATKVLQNVSTKTLLFYGAMGVGKTTLIKELARQLGIKESLQSPTFSLVNEYDCPGGKLFHFDFYRIHGKEEAMDIGIEEYFYSGNWSFVEWPEKINTILPKATTALNIITNKNGTRTLSIE